MSSDLLKQKQVIHDLESNSKKAFFETVSKAIFEQLDNANWETVFDALISREKIGSTGFGNGIAIPHCRLAECHIPMGTLIKLKRPIEFDAIDKDPVDLVFILIVPQEAEDQHLDILSQLASIFDQADSRQTLRSCTSADELHTCFIRMLA